LGHPKLKNISIISGVTAGVSKKCGKQEKTFENIFKDSAVKRIGFEKMKKNIENAI